MEVRAGGDEGLPGHGEQGGEARSRPFALRFDQLAQGGFGANRAELERVRGLGSDSACRDEQFAMP